MSHVLVRRARVVSALVLSAVVLGACGGGESSRTRNNAIVNQSCHASPIAKEQAIATLKDQIAKVEADVAAADVLKTKYENLAKDAQKSWDDFVAYNNSVGNILDTEEKEARSNELLEAHFANKNKMKAAYEAWSEFSGASNSLIGLTNALSRVERKAVCGEGDIIASPSTSSSVGDVTTTSSDQPSTSDQSTTSVATDEPSTSVASPITSVATDAPSTSVAPPTTSSETTAASAETSTTSAVTDSPTTSSAVTPSEGDGEPQVTLSLPNYQESLFDSCGVPTPEEGTTFSAAVGATITLTIPLCEALGDSAALAYSPLQFIPMELLSFKNNKIELKFTSAEDANATLSLWHYSNATNEYGKPNTVELSFVSEDPCTGKKPDATWDPDTSGGTFTATSTCDATTWIRFSVKKKTDDGAVEVCRGWIASGVPNSKLISLFGDGTYEVSLTHGVNTQAAQRVVGDTRTIEVEYTTPTSTSSSVTGSALPPDVANSPDVASVPVAVFTPLVSEPVENPRAVEPEVPVVALPAGTTSMTCDQGCIDAAVSAAGLSDGAVEIAFDAGAWLPISPRSLFLLPAGATNVRLRVTPSSGDPVVMSAVVTRESTDEAVSEVAFEVADVSNVPVVAADDDGGFPWWIVILALVLVVLLGIVRARRGRTPEDTRTV